MSSKSSKYPIVAFEESEQDDSLMEQIFDEISDVPDKEPVLEIPVDKSYHKKKQAELLKGNLMTTQNSELSLYKFLQIKMHLLELVTPPIIT